MKKAFGIALALMAILVLVGLPEAQSLRPKLGWDPPKTLEDGTPIPIGETLHYILYAGKSKETMTERARTDDTKIAISELGLSETDKWAGVAAYTDERFVSEITSKSMIPVKMSVEFRIIYKNED